MGTRPAEAEITVFACQFAGFGREPLYITIYDDGAPARVGVGSRAQAYFDRLTGSTVVVEFNLDQIPNTLTTINRDGAAVHSRHLLSVPKGWFAPSQTTGNCDRRTGAGSYLNEVM